MNPSIFKAHYMLGKYLEEMRDHPIQMTRTVELSIKLPNNYSFSTIGNYKCVTCYAIELYMERKNDLDKREKAEAIANTQKISQEGFKEFEEGIKEFHEQSREYHRKEVEYHQAKLKE